MPWWTTFQSISINDKAILSHIVELKRCFALISEFLSASFLVCTSNFSMSLSMYLALLSLWRFTAAPSARGLLLSVHTLRKADHVKSSCLLQYFVPFFFSITVLSPHTSLPTPPTYCCHCLQPWQQPKTIQGLQQVNIPPDNRSEPDLHCAMLDLDLGQDTSRPPHSMSQTITMHGCSHCWRQLLSLQPCQRLHK